MKPEPRSKSDRKKAKTVLRLPDLEFAKAAVLDSLTVPMLNVGTVTQSTSSLTGIAQNLAWPSIESWFFATEAIWRTGS
jgi:hypothetical protein